VGPWLPDDHWFLQRRYLHPQLGPEGDAAAALLHSVNARVRAWAGADWEDLTGFQVDAAAELCCNRRWSIHTPSPPPPLS
jgi:hypothetical protein